MDTVITLIRHGQSTWNAVGRAQGQAPVPLTEVGRQQARYVAAAMAQDGPVRAIYSSDLLRCRQTVEPIAGVLGRDVRFDARLRERDVGAWQGLTWEERRVFDPENFAAYVQDPIHFAFPGGEDHPTMAARVLAALAEVLAAHPGEHVLIVTHGGPIRAILQHYGLAPLSLETEEAPPLPNASRTRLCVNAGGRAASLLQVGDVSYLPPDLVT